MLFGVSFLNQKLDQFQELLPPLWVNVMLRLTVVNKLVQWGC